MQPGSLVVYDKYGTVWESVSPFYEHNECGIGVIISDHRTESWFGCDTYVFQIMTEDGKIKEISSAYLKVL